MGTESDLTLAEEEAVLDRIVRNQLKIKELTEENDTLKTYYKDPERFQAGEYRTVGKFYVKVSKNTRVDNTLALKNLPAATYKRVAKMTVDAVAAKRYLTPEQYETIVKNYDNKIEVGLQ